MVHGGGFILGRWNYHPFVICYIAWPYLLHWRLKRLTLHSPNWCFNWNHVFCCGIVPAFLIGKVQSLNRGISADFVAHRDRGLSFQNLQAPCPMCSDVLCALGRDRWDISCSWGLRGKNCKGPETNPGNSLEAWRFKILTEVLVGWFLRNSRWRGFYLWPREGPSGALWILAAWSWGGPTDDFCIQGQRPGDTWSIASTSPKS